MKIAKLLLNDHAKFHFGDSSGDLKDHFSSDQLVSALMNNVVLLYGDKQLSEFTSLLREDHIHFSSIFYGLDFLPKQQHKNGATIYFFPRPKVDFMSTEQHSVSNKEIKKINYVSIKLLEKLSKSWNEEEEACKFDFRSIVLIGKKFAVLREEIADLECTEQELQSLRFLHFDSKPGVEVSRDLKKPGKFYFQEHLEVTFDETKYYRVQPFMYFIIDGKLPVFLNAAIQLLADEGIGGKRSLGKGFFHKIEWKETSYTLPQKGRYFMNLSTYFPKKEEAGKLYFYELEKRSGFVYSLGGKTVRKKSAMVINEGSLFREKVKGDMINVEPENFDHSVYLYGKSIFVGFGGKA